MNLDVIDENIQSLRDEPTFKINYISETEIIAHKMTNVVSIANSDTAELLGQSHITEYARSWCKLSRQQKINRLMAYSVKLSQCYLLTVSQQNQVKKLFLECINGDLLNDSQSVDYDSDTGTILKVMGLQRSADGEFYLGINSAEVRNSYMCMPVMTDKLKVKPLSFDQLTAATRGRQPGTETNEELQIKHKPAIIKKHI